MMDLDQFKGHTPGRWRVVRSDDASAMSEGWPIVATSHFAVMCQPMRSDDLGDEESDMTLIAAAPDLLLELQRTQEALTPSAETKAAYIGEFKFDIPDYDDEGEEHLRKVMVPWTTIKEIMEAIRNRAALKKAELIRSGG